MNDAHLHLLVNHFPIIGSIFGLGILITGIALKNKTVKHVAFVLFGIVAVFTFVSMQTGEGAEEIVEEMKISHDLLHEHEELAEKFAVISYLTGASALFALILSLKNNKKTKFLNWLTLLLAIASVVFGKYTGTSGGEIMHTEIREQ